MQTTQFIENMRTLIASMIPPNNLIIASVVTPPPNLSVKFSENIVTSEQLYCSNYLLPNYRRNYKSKEIILSEKDDVSKLDLKFSASNTELKGQGPHQHRFITATASGTSELTGESECDGEIWLTNTLNVGDEVLLGVVGRYYVVMDRIIKMPGSAIEEGA